MHVCLLIQSVILGISRRLSPPWPALTAMAQPPSTKRRQTAPTSGLGRVSALRTSSTLQSIPELGTIAPRRPLPSTSIGLSTSRSFSGPTGSSLPSKPSKTVATPPAKSAQRTTKTSQKLVVLPSEPQTAPLPESLQPGRGDDEDLGPPRASGPLQSKHHELRSEGERMTKAERQRAGYRRLTAYCVAEGFRLKLLLAYLKREHGVSPRVFDEAVYAVSICPAPRIYFPLTYPHSQFSYTISHYYLATDQMSRSARQRRPDLRLEAQFCLNSLKPKTWATTEPISLLRLLLNITSSMDTSRALLPSSERFGEWGPQTPRACSNPKRTSNRQRPTQNLRSE